MNSPWTQTLHRRLCPCGNGADQHNSLAAVAFWHRALLRSGSGCTASSLHHVTTGNCECVKSMPRLNQAALRTTAPRT